MLALERSFLKRKDYKNERGERATDSFSIDEMVYLSTDPSHLLMATFSDKKDTT